MRTATDAGAPGAPRSPRRPRGPGGVRRPGGQHRGRDEHRRRAGARRGRRLHTPRRLLSCRPRRRTAGRPCRCRTSWSCRRWRATGTRSFGCLRCSVRWLRGTARGRLAPSTAPRTSRRTTSPKKSCLAVLTALPNYRVQGKPFLAFVYGIAAHKVIDAHRAVTRGRTEPVADIAETIETAAPAPRAAGVARGRDVRRSPACPARGAAPRSSAEILVLPHTSSASLRRRRPRSSVRVRPRSGSRSTGRMGRLRKNIHPVSPGNLRAWESCSRGSSLWRRSAGHDQVRVRPAVPRCRARLEHWRCSRRVEGTR